MICNLQAVTFIEDVMSGTQFRMGGNGTLFYSFLQVISRNDIDLTHPYYVALKLFGCPILIGIICFKFFCLSLCELLCFLSLSQEETTK